MKKLYWALALACAFVVSNVKAISLDDIQLWAGSGTNRAAVVIEWSAPEISNYSTVPAPIANKTMVWGYRFNGTVNGTQMLYGILAADPKLYLFITNDPSFGTGVNGIGYNLSGDGVIGLTDGNNTNYFNNGLLTNASVNADAAGPLNQSDLYFGGHFGPGWQIWTETNDSGGFFNSPNRGTDPFSDPDTGEQGQWTFADFGLDGLTVTNGSWLGFSVTADGFPTNGDPNTVTYENVFFDDEQAPPSPDGTYVAYVPNTNDFGVQIASTSNVDSAVPYNDPAAILGVPSQLFYDPFDGNVTNRVTVIDPPYNVDTNGNDVITKIDMGGQVTVNMGRRIYANANDPYGSDFIVYGYSFFTTPHTSGGFVSDATDLSTTTLGSSADAGHPTIVSVSQDGVNWFTYTNIPVLFPEQAFRWDDTNSSWTAEDMNPNKPLNPYIYTNNFGGQTIAGILDQFVGGSGGTSFSLQGTGLPWIQYVRVQAETNSGQYTVVDAIAGVNPVVVGDALSIAPDNIAAGSANLFFQRPNDCGQNQIAIGFNSVNKIARISTVSLSDLSSFAPVEGTVSSAYQIMSRPPVTGWPAAAFNATVGLRSGDGYSGNGSDLRVFEWNCTNWISQPFSYNVSNNEVVVAGVTNFSAFVVSQIVPPSLSIQTLTNGFAFQFTPVANCPETLLRSTNLETWTQVCAFTTTNAEPITLQDTNVPAAQAFYRLELTP